MKYEMTKPCAECPFLKEFAKSYGMRRLKEFAASAFPCHKTAELYEDDENGESEFRAASTSQHCAGALIFNEKRDGPNQMMRISERLGMYDYRKLDMDSPVV